MIQSAEDCFIDSYLKSKLKLESTRKVVKKLGSFYASDEDKRLYDILTMIKGEGDYRLQEDLGIGIKDKSILNKLGVILKGLGYLVERSCSSSWSNERIFIKINKEQLRDKVLCESLINLNNKED